LLKACDVFGIPLVADLLHAVHLHSRLRPLHAPAQCQRGPAQLPSLRQVLHCESLVAALPDGMPRRLALAVLIMILAALRPIDACRSKIVAVSLRRGEPLYITGQAHRPAKQKAGVNAPPMPWEVCPRSFWLAG
jgi:hypothetical protein